MANGNDLAQAYSILGQGMTAEYERRRREEEEYRKRARRDQLLGYLIAPIGQELAKGVSQVISAPFQQATEKFLATEQGRALNKDIAKIGSFKSQANARDKEINSKFAGDDYAYHLDMVERNITKQTRADFIQEFGVSESALDDKNTDISRRYRSFLQEQLARAEEIAKRETEEYQAFRAAVSSYKTGQDAKEVVSRYGPYAKGPLGGIINVGKRLFSGMSFSEAISGPSQEEKDKAVIKARQTLNLTDQEFASLSEKAKSGLSFAKLDEEIDKLATSKDPAIEQLRIRQKRDEEFHAAFDARELPAIYTTSYRRYMAEKDGRRPGLDELMFYMEEKQGIDALGFSENERGNIITKMNSVPSVVSLGNEFKESILKDMDVDDPTKASATQIQRAEKKWENVLDSALYQAQIEYAQASNIAPEDNPLLLMSAGEKRSLIIQNAIDKLSMLEREPAEEQGAISKFFGMEHVPTPGRFTGAFNFDALKASSPESAAPQVSTQAAPPSLGPLPRELEQDIIRTVTTGDEAGAIEKIKLLEEGGYTIPIALKNLEVISIEEPDAGPLSQAERKRARGRGQRVDLSELLPESPSQSGRMKRALKRNLEKAQEAEPVSTVTQGPTAAQRMDSLLADIGVDERDLEPTPRTSFESSPSSFVASIERRTNRLDVPNVRTKAGRGIVSKMKQEVKEQLGVELSRKETQQVVDGLIDPSEDQIQGILDILSKRPPIKGMTMEPSEDQIAGLLKVLEGIAPAKKSDPSLLSDTESLDIDRQIARELADDIKSLRGFSGMNRQTIEERIANMNVSSGIRDLALQFIFE
tara:strand:- start:4167 stop:6611 length:2445 start_codon:yes stop_codon:yes gene_type:complete